MNTKLKLVRLVLAATFGSLLWAGCASDQIYYGDSSSELRPVDLTKNRADTRPELRSGAEQYTGWDSVSELPAESPAVIEESAGAQRPR